MVCIGVPLKSRQNARFWTPMDTFESGVPSTSTPRRRSSPKEINHGILGNQHRYWTSCIDESEVRIKPSEKQKSRRRALKRSTIDFRGTHVVCIGVPLKSRQNARFWTPMDIPEVGGVGHGWYPTKRLQNFGWEIGTHGMQSEIESIGREIGTHGNAS